MNRKKEKLNGRFSPIGSCSNIIFDVPRGSGLTSLPEDLTVRGSLRIGSTNITSLPKGIKVRGNLYLDGLRIQSLPEDLIVGGNLSLNHCKSLTSLPDGLIVGGDLELLGSGIASLPEDLTVGGDLDIRSTNIRSLPERLIVLTNLYCDHHITLTSQPEGLIVGGGIYRDGDLGTEAITPDNRHIPSALFWQSRDATFVKADGLFHQVIAHHGNVYKVREIGGDQDIFLVTDGSGRWAHGTTLAEARQDLLYKISHRDKSRYVGLPLDHSLTVEEAIQCYRVVTGACEAGVKEFVINTLPQSLLKDSYKIGEIIELTRGQYGAKTFADFFRNR